MDEFTSILVGFRTSINALERKVKYLQDYVTHASPPEASVYLSELQAKLDEVDRQKAEADKANTPTK